MTSLSHSTPHGKGWYSDVEAFDFFNPLKTTILSYLKISATVVSIDRIVYGGREKTTKVD